jgi:hypothetical protein
VNINRDGIHRKQCKRVNVKQKRNTQEAGRDGKSTKAEYTGSTKRVNVNKDGIHRKQGESEREQRRITQEPGRECT